jgi:hypothetical protein
MKNTTPFFPGFHIQTLRKTPKSTQQKLLDEQAKIKQKSFGELSEYLKFIVPISCIKKSCSGAMSRLRLFGKENTFWAFFSQILDADGGCQEVVRKLQAFAAINSRPIPSSSTSAYCQARQKLSQTELENVLSQMPSNHKVNPIKRLQGRRVVVVDGTGVSMPDTPGNQAEFPQPASQKPGCGFPQARICACFNLDTGMLISHATGNKKSHELPLLRQQWAHFKTNDIFLGDKGFCSYYDFSCFSDQGVDSVVTLARRKPLTALNADDILGDNDLLIHWDKPKWSKATSYTKAQWISLPDQLTLRQIKVTIAHQGFRVSSFYIVTTLLDAIKYPAYEIADLYYQRWDVELFFRDIKTTLKMDILRCKTPDMIRKELVMHWIVYNCIRQLMMISAHQADITVRQVSFKGSVQAIRQWEPHLNQMTLSQTKRDELINTLYDAIADKVIFDRPQRQEPRTVKRRPKPFRLMTVPRSEMIDHLNDEKRRAKMA